MRNKRPPELNAWREAKPHPYREWGGIKTNGFNSYRRSRIYSSICLPNFGFFPKIMRNESPATSTHCTSIKIRRDMHRYYTLDVTTSPKQFDQKCGRQSHLVH